MSPLWGEKGSLKCQQGSGQAWVKRGTQRGRGGSQGCSSPVLSLLLLPCPCPGAPTGSVGTAGTHVVSRVFSDFLGWGLRREEAWAGLRPGVCGVGRAGHLSETEQRPRSPRRSLPRRASPSSAVASSGATFWPHPAFMISCLGREPETSKGLFSPSGCLRTGGLGGVGGQNALSSPHRCWLQEPPGPRQLNRHHRGLEWTLPSAPSPLLTPAG